MLLGCGLAMAEDSPADEESRGGAASIAALFRVITEAWNEGDERALADVVHPDGVRISTGGKGDRLTRYSPSQSFYYFKNLFQTRKTLEFSFVRVQDNDDEDRTHALASWRWRSEGSDQDQVDDFIFVLEFALDRWFVSEISSIK